MPIVIRAVSPHRLEHHLNTLALAENFDRLRRLNLNSFTRNSQALAVSFMRNVINGIYYGNNAARQRALNALNRVRRIGGGDIPLNQRNRAHAAATTIQARARGISARKRANARRTKLVHGPGGNVNYMVAVPNRRSRT